MKVYMNGIIYKIIVDEENYELTFLSFYDEIGEITDGVCINDEMYNSLKSNQICYCAVNIKDGTSELKIDDIHYFVENIKDYQFDIFYTINNIMVYEYNEPITKIFTDDKYKHIITESIYKRNLKINENWVE